MMLSIGLRLRGMISVLALRLDVSGAMTIEFRCKQ
jgi:hypothetical protein